MHTFTALFDKRADAEAVQARLQQLGIVDLDHGLHDRETVGFDKAEVGSGGLWGSFKGAVPPYEDRHLYDEAVRRGGFLLTVNVDDQEADQVLQVLEGSDAVDFEERGRQIKQSGFVAPPMAAANSAQSEEHIPILEEQLLVGKREVERGGVRVRAYVVERPVSEQVRLREEHVEIERRATGERVSNAEGLFEARTIELTETEEEAVVGKSSRVVEEVVVRKDVEERAETISDNVRHTEVEVDRLDGQGPQAL